MQYDMSVFYSIVQRLFILLEISMLSIYFHTNSNFIPASTKLYWFQYLFTSVGCCLRHRNNWITKLALICLRYLGKTTKYTSTYSYWTFACAETWYRNIKNGIWIYLEMAFTRNRNTDITAKTAPKCFDTVTHLYVIHRQREFVGNMKDIFSEKETMLLRMQMKVSILTSTLKQKRKIYE